MPTVNATIVRITSTISSMCFFIKKRGQGSNQKKWQFR